MIEQGLLDYFVTHHLPRGEVLNLLPFSVSIEAFWPELLRLRKTRAVEAPLKGVNSQPLWFVMTDSLMASGDRIASMARRNIDRIGPGEDIMTDGLMDEAFFTSFVEGAPVSRLECRRFLKSGDDPSNVGELLAQNNLGAIRCMAERHYEPFSCNMLHAYTRLLTNAMEVESEGYRASNEHRVPGRSKGFGAVPPAREIPGMMDSLCLFLNDYEMHPLLKAAIAHAYILLVRPYDEGNERLARLVSCSLLLRNGYSFFRQFALSGMIAQDGILYYKAMETLQDDRNGGDLTCFCEYYLGLLSRSVNGFEAYIAQKHRNEKEKKQPEEFKRSDQPMEIHPLTHQMESPLPPRKKTPELPASQNGKNESIDGIEKCMTPEMMIAYITTQQGKHLGIIDAKPYLDKLGITEEEILKAMQNSSRESSQRALSVIRMFRANPARKFTCRDIEQIMSLKNGTARRICYVLASLNLIQATQSSGHGNGHDFLRFFYNNALAA